MKKKMSIGELFYKTELSYEYVEKIMKGLKETRDKEKRKAKIGSILVDLLNKYDEEINQRVEQLLKEIEKETEKANGQIEEWKKEKSYEYKFWMGYLVAHERMKDIIKKAFEGVNEDG